MMTLTGMPYVDDTCQSCGEIVPENHLTDGLCDTCEAERVATIRAMSMHRKPRGTVKLLGVTRPAAGGGGRYHYSDAEIAAMDVAWQEHTADYWSRARGGA